MNEKYNVYLVSDSTGETLDRIFLSIKSQFSNFEYNKKEFDALKQKGSIDTSYPIMDTPLKTLIKGITSRSDITSFHFIENKNS